jgi:hypothetical protein
MDTSLIRDVDEARRIAIQWQSPGSIGHVLASFASGLKVSRWRLIDDIAQTQRHSPGMSLDDWADLDRLTAWCKVASCTYLSGPPGDIRVITNWHVRDVLRWHDLTPFEHEEFDYLDPETGSDHEFVRYRGDVIDVTDMDGIATSELASKGWSTYASDSFFSGIVVKWFDDDGNLIDGGDGVIVGRYCA